MPFFASCFGNGKKQRALIGSHQQQAKTVCREERDPAVDDSLLDLTSTTIEVRSADICGTASQLPGSSAPSSPKKKMKVRGPKADQRSLRPKKNHRTSKHRTLHTMKKTANRTLTLEAAAKIPSGESAAEWHAVNTLDFYNDLSLLMGILEELCTATTCPCMSAGPNFKYLWADKGAKPVCLCAADYVEKMMIWVEKQLDDPAIFVIDGGNYPKDFHKAVKNIFRKLFRAYAHAYHSHFDAFVSLGAESHLNTCFKHFIIYGQEHKLLDDKDTAPLKDFIPSLIKGGGKGLLQNSLA